MSDIHFGTDGWRAIIGEGFTLENAVKVANAAAIAFSEKAAHDERDSQAQAQEAGKLYVGYDCRQDAAMYAENVAEAAANHGFKVVLTDKFCPTPALCWSVAHDPEAVGGIMLTSSHNPAEYLGIKLRMADGGASPKEFTDRVEVILDNFASNSAEDVTNAIPGEAIEADIMTPYLAALRQQVDEEAIRAAGLRIVVDPLYGAGRGYLAEMLRSMGVKVEEINNATDPTFDGLHPEPIPPWIDRGLAKVAELGYDALFINDGDADRIGAGDSKGDFVNPHRIIALVTQHLVNRGETGRVVSTVTSSALLDRLCRKLGLELVITPVGFKWIYGEMAKGGVMIGGEESGGIGLPEHVKERDGLLMALLLTEMMAQTGKNLGTLVDELLDDLGHMEFARRGLTVTDEQMDAFRNSTMPDFTPENVLGESIVNIDRRDGVKFIFGDDSWVMMRPSGTEPLVRVYAEAATKEKVNALLDWATEIVTS